MPAEQDADHRALQADLRRFAASRLLPAERPGAYTFGSALPGSKLGKLTDWTLTDWTPTGPS